MQPAECSRRHLLTLQKYNHIVRAKAEAYGIWLNNSNVDLALLEKTRYGMVWKRCIEKKLKRNGQAKQEYGETEGSEQAKATT